MNDPADIVGWTKDGSEYGYCASIGARGIPKTDCDFVRADSSHHTLSSDDAKGYSPGADKSLREWVKDQAVPKIPTTKDFTKRLANPLTGNWAFTDITIWVNPVGADGVKTNAQLKVGGLVTGEQVVYPVVLEAKPNGPVKYHTAIANDLSLSPSGADIGVVASFFCAEWCNAFEVYRAHIGSFASLVYNDAGIKRHKKGDYARAAELFLEAANADPSGKLPAYNLACAWARLKDPRVKDALAVAIERDPDVKKRAQSNEDFAAVKSESWFTDLVR